MEALDTVFFALSLSLKLFTVYFAAVVIAGLLRRRPRYPRATPKTRFAVVVAARNEEAVIADLVYSVRNQRYPRELADVYVVPNNCTDFTEAAAASAGAHIIHCLGPVRSKGDALHQAFTQLLPKGYDAFLVLDADNTLSPDYLARMNDAFAAGAMVCKSRMAAANPTAAPVAGCYALYNALFDLIWNRPRAALGLSAKLVGSGFAVRREVLERLGGWNTATIAEDAEFAAQLAQAGYQVEWVREAVNYDEEPTDFRLSLRQRRRWCSGVMQVAKRRLVPLWRKDSPAPRLRWDMTMFLLAPFTGSVSALLLAGSLLAGVLTGDMAGVTVCLGSMCLAWAGGVVLGAALCLLGGYRLRGMTAAAALFPVFLFSFLPLQVISLFWDTKQWQAVPHRGGARVAPSRG